MASAREQKDVHDALSQVGFVPIGSMDFVYRKGPVACAIPLEATNTFETAIRFLREGAFQDTLLKETRSLYHQLAEQLSQCLKTKGTHERRPQDRLDPTA